jgi:hypothetical protein
VATWLLLGRPSSVLVRLILNLRPLTDGDAASDGRHGFIVAL